MADDHRGKSPKFKLRSVLSLGLLLAGLGLVGWQDSTAARSVTFKRTRISRPKHPNSHQHHRGTYRSPRHHRGTYQSPDRKVLVEFVGLGKDWGRVELNNRLIYHPQNHNRRRQVYLSPGAYYLEITGITPFDAWASGYLDVGRDDVNVIVVYFSKDGGVQVSGSPYTWIPDAGRSRY